MISKFFFLVELHKKKGVVDAQLTTTPHLTIEPER